MIDLGPTFWRGTPDEDQADNPDDLDREEAARAASEAEPEADDE